MPRQGLVYEQPTGPPQPPQRERAAPMKNYLLITALVGMLLLALLGAVVMWLEAGDVVLSLHGIIALLLGVALSLALGGGLMALVFYSSRHGYDDEAGR